MPNMSSVIKQHDQKVLSSSQTKENINVTSEILPTAHSTVNVLLKTLFIRQLYQQSSILIHITVVVKISSFAITTLQKHFATIIIKTIQTYLNVYGTLKTQERIITLPGVLLHIPHPHTDVVQEDMISTSGKVHHSTWQSKNSFEQKDRNHLEMPA